MLKHMRAFLALTALALVGGCSIDTAGIPSPVVGKFLGEGVVHVLAAPDAVETFRVQPSLSPPPVPTVDGPDTVAGYRWVARGAPLAATEVAEFSKLALNEKSYVFDVAKKCMLVPEYALRVRRGEDSVVVLLSFSCAMWKFVHAGEGRLEDFDPIAKRLEAVVGTVFKVD